MQADSPKFRYLDLMEKKNTLKILIIACFFILLNGCLEVSKAISLDRVAVTGASVTAGWGVQTLPVKGDFGGYPVNLQHIMDAMILDPHEEVAYFGNAMFFTRPDRYGLELIEEITQYEPTLVVAIDYLFWFAYGNIGSPEKRIEKFERGLSLLGNIEAPLIIGDIPDVHKAIGKMLSASQVPSVNTINTMNRMLRAWAIVHPNAIVLDVHGLYTALLNDTAITLHSYTWPSGSQSNLLQSDMLHTTLEGTVAASFAVADAIGGGGFETNPNVLMKNAAANARQKK